jgi:hypothetical protein
MSSGQLPTQERKSNASLTEDEYGADFGIPL